MCKMANETDDVTKIYKSYDNYTYVHIELQCEGEETYIWSQNHWHLTENGTVINGELYELNNYCIEQTKNVAITCHNKFPTLNIILVLSIVCLVIIIVFHCISDELRNKPITPIKVPFLFFLGLSYLILVVKNKFHTSLVTNTSGCIITALLFHFSDLSALFWMTCISSEVWLRFRKIKDIQATEVSRNHIYYTVSILGPAIITLVTMILQFVDNQDEAGYIHPSLCKGGAVFASSPLPRFLYFHLVIISGSVFNFLLFLAMINKLIKGPWNLLGKELVQTSMSMSPIEPYRIFLELFFIMGVDRIAWGAYQIVDWVHPGHPILFLLQIVPKGNGVFLFIFFICKASNRELFAKMLPSSPQKSTAAESSSTLP